MCPSSPKGVATHRLRTTTLKRKEPKTRLQEEMAERAQPDYRTLLNPDSYWVIFPVFLRGKRPHIQLSGLGNEQKEQRSLGRVQMGPPKPLLCAAVAASTSECEPSVESLTCVYHEHLLIHKVVYGSGKKNTCRKAMVEPHRSPLQVKH